MRKLWMVWVACLAAACGPSVPEADVLYRGGTFYTMNPAAPVAEAVAVKGDTILFVGKASEADQYIGKQTKVVELNGATATPGFIETHGHLMGLGYGEFTLDLQSVQSYDEMVQKVKEAVALAKPGQWILGRGWHQDLWTVKPEKMVKGFQTHEKLSAVSPDNPVWLVHRSGHAAMANAKAMQMAGVNQLSKEKIGGDGGEGGEVVRDQMGNPTGIFNERAQALVRRIVPESTPETDRLALEAAMVACGRSGITTFHDAGAKRSDIELMQAVAKEGKLTTRLYVMVTGRDPALVQEWFSKGPSIDPRGVTVRSVKLNCDGALGSRGAWLLEPYTDRPGFSGMATLSMDTVLSVSRQALAAGFQVCSHAIGDRANREVLDRYETAMKEHPEVTDHRFRIEHAQHIDPADLPRFAKLGVIAAVQAIHLSSDRPWAIDRLGEKRIKEGAYMWQSLIQSGAKVVNGTDVPVEPINPIASFYASVTRKTLKGEPEGGYEPKEKMTREQALRAYTLDAAFSGFEEKSKGSLEVGKLADLTVFSKDLMTVPESEMLATEVVMTIVGGRVVYEKK